MRDDELENAIEAAGADRVMARAGSYGWLSTGMAPPKWVWWEIVREINEGKPPPVDNRSLSEQLLGFNLF